MTRTHDQDADCTVDPSTLTCTTCGVDHSGECDRCHGRGFHKVGCPDSDATQPDLECTCCPGTGYLDPSCAVHGSPRRPDPTRYTEWRKNGAGW